MSGALSRRGFLSAAGTVGVAAALEACTSSPSRTRAPAPTSLIGPDDPAVAAAEARRVRAATGRTVTALLQPQPGTIDLGGRQVHTWLYGDRLPGPAIRVRVGDRLRVQVRNSLPQPTTVHWHGLAIRNNMDGVPGVTQPAIAPGAAFDYDFLVPDAGTYWFHSHPGTQLDRGLYGPLIVDDPNEPGVDVDEVLVIDDWLDGIAGTPDQELAALQHGMGGMGGTSSAPSGGMSMSPSGGMSGMGGLGSGMTAPVLGGDAGDVAYPLHLINGRPGSDRPTIAAPPRGKVRLRLINAGSDTAYRVAVGGHQLTVTHADGRAVRPVQVDAVLLGMGERYDVEFVAQPGVWPIVAAAEGKNATVSAVLRTSDTKTTIAPAVGVRPAELTGRLLGYRDLTPAAGQRLAGKTPDARFTVTLTGDMTSYRWALGGDAARLRIRPGQRVQIAMRNISPMWHPMHLHGHTFALADYAGTRKDTVIVLPKQTVRIEFDADNPGQWRYHCHNVYHQVAGMETVLRYMQ